MTTKEVSELTGISQRSIRRLCKNEIIPAKKLGKVWYICTEAFNEIFSNSKIKLIVSLFAKLLIFLHSQQRYTSADKGIIEELQRKINQLADEYE